MPYIFQPMIPAKLRELLGWWRYSPYRFQPFTHTLPDRYPWLFAFARDMLGDGDDRRLLSFGCSVGDEAFSLRRYFPQAAIKGIDINPGAIAACRRRARADGHADLVFATADSTASEPTGWYDAIFCLAVLCNGTLTVSAAQSCASVLSFARFEHMVEDFARCLKPGGLLFLLTTNFRLCDTRAGSSLDVVLHAEPEMLAPDVLFDRDGRLMPNARYTAVGFRKHVRQQEGAPPDGTDATSFAMDAR